LGDRGSITPRDGCAVEACQSPIQIFQAGPGQSALDGYVAKLLAQVADDLILAAGHCRYRRVAGFGNGGKRHRLGRKEAGHAKARAGSEREHGCARDTMPAPNRIDILRLQFGQRPGNGFEVVEEPDGGKSKRIFQIVAVDQPSAVGGRAAVVFNRSGNGQYRCADPAEGSTMLQECCDGLGHARKLGNPEMLDSSDAAVICQRKARVRAADICEKHALIGRGSAVAHHLASVSFSGALPLAGIGDVRLAAM